MLTRQHFAAVAAILATTSELSPEAHRALVNRFSMYFSLENPRFNSSAFEAAASHRFSPNSNLHPSE